MSTTIVPTEEDLIAALDSNVDQFNEMLAHSSTTVSLLDNTIRSMPSLRVSESVAGIMELSRRRDIYIDRVEKRGQGQGNTLSDMSICADQLEEQVVSSGASRFGYDDIEKIKAVMIKYWKYKLDEIAGQKFQLLSRWSRYCRTSDMIARTQNEFQSTIISLSEEYDRTVARILRVERNDASPLPAELENYSMWLLKRQQCNEHLRRFYIQVKWLPYHKRGSLILNISTLLKQQHVHSMKNNDTNILTNHYTSLENEVIVLLNEYYRGGPGDGSKWSGIPNVEDDYSTESSFLHEFHEQQQKWNFLPYGSLPDTIKKESGEGENEGENEGEENDDGLTVPTYIKPSNWTPFVHHLEERLHHCDYSINQCSNSGNSEGFSSSGSKCTIGGSKNIRPPEVPSVRNGQENISRLNIDQILLTEMECLHDNDSLTVLERLRTQIESHSVRCQFKTSNTNSTGSSSTSNGIATLHDRSEMIFERNISERKEEEDNDGGGDRSSTVMKNDYEEVEGDDGIMKKTLLRILYRQRHLKLRSMRRRLLGYLNYCRSIQKKLTIDYYYDTTSSDDSGRKKGKENNNSTNNRTSNPGLNLKHELHRSPYDLSNGSNSSEKKMDREDEFTVETSTCDFGLDIIHVVDSHGVRVMYECSLNDMEIMEHLLLSIGTRATLNIENSNHNNNNKRKIIVDRVNVLIDLYACELKLKDAIRSYVDTLMRIYDTTVHDNDRNIISSEIINSMRSRPFHEKEDGAMEYNYRTHYELLVATIQMKNKLLKKMMKNQILSERKTNNDGNANETRTSLAAVFELTLSMGNISKFFPLWNVTLSKMMEIVSTTHMCKTASTIEDSTTSLSAVHVGHVEIISLRLLWEMYEEHEEKLIKENDCRACQYNAHQRSNEINVLSSSKLSSWGTLPSDIKILLKKFDDEDVSTSSSFSSTKEGDDNNHAAASEEANKALNNLVRHSRNTIDIDKRSRRRVALITTLHLREESAYEYWECKALEIIYNKQCKLYGNDIVHNDRESRLKLMDNLEKTTMTSTATIMQLKSNTLGGLNSLKQWSIGCIFDPALCKEYSHDLCSRSGRGPSTLEKILQTGKNNNKNNKLNNINRKMIIDRMKVTIQTQAIEKYVFITCIQHNFIVLEALECVEILGEVELRHRGGVSENSSKSRDPTFITRQNDSNQQHHRISDSEMRQIIKTERHKIHECFASVYLPRLEIRDRVMLNYRAKSDSVISKHHQRNAAADDAAAGNYGGGSSKTKHQRRGSSKNEGKTDEPSNNTIHKERQLELEVELTQLKASTIEELWVTGILEAYRHYSVRPQIVQQYSTIAYLTSILRLKKMPRNEKHIFTRNKYKFGKNIITKSFQNNFITNWSTGTMNNPFHIPTWYEIHCCLLKKRITPIVNDEGKHTETDDDDDDDYLTDEQKSKKKIKLLHTMLKHSLILKKLLQALHLRSLLLSCGISEYGDRGTGARMRSALVRRNEDNDDDSGDLNEQSIAALDAFRHEIDKIKIGVERLSNNTSSNEEEHSEDDHRHLEEGAILQYLDTRATVELSKLRAALKYTHDQVTGVAQEETIPLASARKEYSTIEEKEKEANDAGISLNDWLEMENIEQGQLDKVIGLHERLLHASRSALSDLDDGPRYHHHGGTIHMHDSHLSLSSSSYNSSGNGGAIDVNVGLDGGMLAGSPGFIETVLEELQSVNLHVPYGHPATLPSSGTKKKNRENDNDGAGDDDDANDNNINNKNKLWNSSGIGAPWKWMSLSHDYSKIYTKEMNSSRKRRLYAWGPYINLTLPLSLSPWYAFTSKRFDERLTPTLRNHLGAALHMIELRVEGASLLAMNAAKRHDDTDGKTSHGGSIGIAVGTKRWRDLPSYEKETKTSSSTSHPLVEAIVQLNYLNKQSVLRSYKLALYRLFDVERKNISVTTIKKIVPTVTCKINSEVLALYEKHVTCHVREIVTKLRQGSDSSAIQQVEESVMSLLPTYMQRNNSNSSTSNSSKYSSMSSIKTEQESSRLSKEISSAHLLSIEISIAKKCLLLQLIKHQSINILKKRNALFRQSHNASTELMKKENLKKDNNPTLSPIDLVMREEDPNAAIINVFRSTMLKCFTEVSPFSQDRPVRYIEKDSIDESKNNSKSNDCSVGSKNNEIADPRRRKYQVHVDAFETCLDNLGNDVRDLLTKARKIATTTTTAANTTLSNTTLLNEDETATPSMIDVCRQLSYQLLCKEQMLRLQGHAYRRTVNVLEGRKEHEITRRCYNLLFEIDKLKNDNIKLIKKQSSIIKKSNRDARKRYRSQILTLQQQLNKSNSMFGQYKESMRSDMLNEISVAKKAALLKIVDSSTVTKELRQRAIKIAAVEDEISELKRNNGSLRTKLQKVQLEFENYKITVNNQHSKEIESLEDELEVKSKSWAKLSEMERKDIQRQKELNLAQTSSSRLVNVVTNLLTKLEASEKSKKSLQQWKIRNQHTMMMLEKQMSTLQRGLNGEAVEHVTPSNINDDNDDGDKNSPTTNDRDENIREAREWSEGVLEKRHQNYVISLTRQLTREKKQHRQTTDMLRRTMAKLRALEAKAEKDNIIKSSNSSKEKEWTNSKEISMTNLSNLQKKTKHELLTTRAKLGAIKEEHARLLEYLRTMGITAPGGDITNFSASRYMSGFDKKLNNRDDEEDYPPHRRTFSFSVSPSKKNYWNTSNVDNGNGSFSGNNRKGTVPVTVDVETPRDSSVEGWRHNIQNQESVNRPSSAPSRKRFVRLNTTLKSEKEITQKMIQNQFSKSHRSDGTIKKNKKRRKRPKSAMVKTRNDTFHVSSTGTSAQRSRIGSRLSKAPNLGIGTSFYTSK